MTRPPLRLIQGSDCSWVESLRYSLDVFDDRGNLAEVLGRLADLDPARAAFALAVAKYPTKRIMLCQGGRILARSDKRPEWLAAYQTILVVKEEPPAD
jgi:hypothetical protein